MVPDRGLLDPADSGAESRAKLDAWLALQDALGLFPQDAAVLLRRTGDPGAAMRSSGRVPWRSPGRRNAAIESLRRCGAIGVPLLSAAYPERLAALSDPAPLLWIRGDVDVLEGPCVAIVGSRAATRHGRATAFAFASTLARAGVVVVSGLARGIDAAAHWGALEAGGRSVAVQACGPDRVYPHEHRALAERIVRQGALVTEFPPDTPPRQHHFPLRNRLISGLSIALLVVEARERSGSLVTAGHAANQGVDVFAVPGGTDAPASRGTNRLLRDGAFVALEPRDVLDELVRVGACRAAPSDAEPAAPKSREAAAFPDRASTRAIRAALREAPATRDELTRRLSRAPEQLALDLLELELAGCIAEDRDGRLRVVSPQHGREL